jgi:hypothetical protein
MLKEINDINEVQQFFNNLVNNTEVLGSKVKLAQIYGAAKRWYEVDEESHEARKYFDDKRYIIENQFKVSDDIWIIVLDRKDTKEKWFAPVVNSQSIHEFFDTIEKAIVCATSYKLTGRTDAGFWAMKMIESVSTKGD